MGIKYNNPLNGGKYFFLLRYSMTLSPSIIPLSFALLGFLAFYAFAAMFLVSCVSARYFVSNKQK